MNQKSEDEGQSTPEQERDIYILAKHGCSIQEMSERFNLSNEAVCKILERVGKKPSIQLTEAINMAIKEGITVREVGMRNWQSENRDEDNVASGNIGR